MNLYRVYGFGPRGATTIARTSKADAEPLYRNAVKRFRDMGRGLHYWVRLQKISVPDRMTGDDWIHALETGEIPFTIVEEIARETYDGEIRSSRGKS